MSFPRPVTVERTDTFDVWRQKCNQLSQEVGNLDNLIDPLDGSSSIVEALNELSEYAIEIGRAYWIRSIAMN